MRLRIVSAAALAFIITALGLSVVRAPAVEESGMGQMDMEKMIAAAKTPADHEQLAAMYDQEAAAARARADTHRKMAAAYRKEGGAIVSKLHFDQHCDALVNSYTSAAQSYEDLAKGERELAKQTK
jgi:hypothetical protein